MTGLRTVTTTLPRGFHIDRLILDELADVDSLPDDLAHWLDELADARDLDDLSQDPLVNERPAFDQDTYYDGFGEP